MQQSQANSFTKQRFCSATFIQIRHALWHTTRASYAERIRLSGGQRATTLPGWRHFTMPAMPANTPPSTHDTTRIDDVRINTVRPLISPALLQERLPLDDASAEQIRQHRQIVSDILHGRDDRLLVIVGPCSIHDHDQAIEYARQLKDLAQQYQNELFVIMRVYFEKPRTTMG